MSVRIMSQVWELPHLATGERLLLLAIADHCNDDGVCYPSAQRLRVKCGWGSSATYTRHIKILQGAKLIKKTPRASTKEGRKTDLIEVIHSNIHTGVLFDLLKVSRKKYSSNTAINSHGCNDAPTKGLSPQVFTRVNTNHKGLSQEEKVSSTDFDIQTESNSIADELESTDNPLSTGIGCEVLK
jgi:hypothetical protein